ncbi:flagellar hook-basal body complex protein FliE [Paraburkholderia sp. IW21]|uniref:flagellar hook-basal body complex protein FliE n=1 Tax=Paraburkholderia sp. IW21 TaxID=3242488 RepID=UPI003521A4E2
MNVTEIGAIQGASSAQASTLAPVRNASESFGSMLMGGVMNVDHAVQSANAAVAGFALGNELPPHQVMLALEDARLQLQFALQVRSRLVEGYQELMRMQL